MDEALYRRLADDISEIKSATHEIREKIVALDVQVARLDQRLESCETWISIRGRELNGARDRLTSLERYQERLRGAASLAGAIAGAMVALIAAVASAAIAALKN